MTDEIFHTEIQCIILLKVSVLRGIKMEIQVQKMTVEQFDEWIFLPENIDHNYEYVAGEIINVVSNQYSSKIAGLMLTYINIFVIENSLGDVTGADGGYHVAGERYLPDVGFISRARQAEPNREAYNSNPPDLAVEVISPTDAESNITIKVGNYLAAGTVVWIVRPETKTFEVYTPNQPVQILGEEDTLDGGDVLPNFTLAIKKIFVE
jgi:Uma2 family endonuclease